jgi:probable F420-dependent oxidoreductase
MKFGLHLGTRGPAAAPDSLVAIARKAEALGFAHLGFSDHVVIATKVDSVYPYTPTGQWFAQDTGVCLEQITTLSFVAAATSRIRLLTSVMVLPHRHPVLAAKMLATADILSKGRVTAGLGVGWMAEELALLGAPPFESRGKACDEYIEGFRALWTQARPAYDGTFVKFGGLKFEPKPAQQAIPIWVGGETPPARRRAGRLGDGWYPVSNNPAAPYDTPEAFAAGLAEVRANVEKAGRDPAKLDVGLLAIRCKLGQEEKARDGGRARFTGSAQAIVDDVGAFAARGLQHLVIGGESAELNQALDRVEQFATQVMAKVR